MSASHVCASFFPPLSSCLFSRCCGLVSLFCFSCILFTTEFYVILYSLRLEASQLSLWRGVSISFCIHWCIAADWRSGCVLVVSLVFIALYGIGQRLHCVAGGISCIHRISSLGICYVSSWFIQLHRFFVSLQLYPFYYRVLCNSIWFTFGSKSP